MEVKRNHGRTGGGLDMVFPCLGSAKTLKRNGGESNYGGGQ